jgi:hypothetical protein
MYPPFGESTIYLRLSRFLREFLKKAYERIKSARLPRPTLGNVWLRLSYFEQRLHRLDEENQEIFIENFYHSARQINYMTLLSVFVIILTYLTTFQFRMIGFWEGLTVEVLLVFTLFYMVWYYRMGMEDLMSYLISQETVPDYAFRPRLGHKPFKPEPLSKSAVSGKPKRKPRKR